MIGGGKARLGRPQERRGEDTGYAAPGRSREFGRRTRRPPVTPSAGSERRRIPAKKKERKKIGEEKGERRAGYMPPNVSVPFGSG